MDLQAEHELHKTVLRLAEAMLISSAHDCSDGGVAVAIAECCFSSLGRPGIGAEIGLTSRGLSPESLLFGETPSRIVISFAPEKLDQVRAIAATPFELIGTVTGSRLRIAVDDCDTLNSPVADLEIAWSESLGRQLSSPNVQ